MLKNPQPLSSAVTGMSQTSLSIFYERASIEDEERDSAKNNRKKDRKVNYSKSSISVNLKLALGGLLDGSKRRVWDCRLGGSRF